MPTWVTGSNRRCRSAKPAGGSSPGGFSLVELLAALAIAALIMGLALPSSMRMYASMEDRQALRETLVILAAARARALSSGEVQDVFVRPAEQRIWSAHRQHEVPERMQLSVQGAAELNREGVGVIRFYPGGGSSGGGVDFTRRDGSGTRIAVDWLVGSVVQMPLSVDH